MKRFAPVRFAPGLAAWLVLVTVVPLAAGQTQVYQWTDEDGVVHFSTEPPAADTAGVERRTVQQAPKVGSVPPEIPAPAPEPEPEREEPAVDPVLAAQRRQQLCEQGRQLVSLLEVGLRRVSVTRADGSTEILMGEDRVAELEKARQLVAENCPD